MSNKGKILGFGALGLALLASSKKASSKALVQDTAPVSLLKANTDADSVLNIIKNNGALRSLLKGEKGDKGETGETGESGISSLPDGLSFVNDRLKISQQNPLNTVVNEVSLANGNSVFETITPNGLQKNVTFYDGTNAVSVLQINSDGSILKIGGGSFSALSDQRTKDNIQPFSDGLNKVLSINPKSFQYKAVEGTPTENYPDFICNKTQYGVIAQDLETVAPEMVTVGQDGYLTVDLSNLSLLLVNAVKELNKKDTDQQKIITSQAAKIKALEDQQALILDRLSSLESK